MDSIDYKAGMRRLAGTVCVVTTDRSSEDPAPPAAPGGLGGLTSTAVCSLSADPPRLLCCVNQNSNTAAAIRANGVFAVNVLAEEDEEVARQFATGLPAHLKFKAGAWRVGLTGAPVLSTASAVFDCRVRRITEEGSHLLVIGDVAAVHAAGNGKPLLYAHGAYGRLAHVSALVG
ncbi:flavin reductase family protein [Bradyrhizobium sp. STM 3561]|uniref:flavin reductase family protein n=1 Tax=unclassified Bradyrhizobium TaxID=2631580 RepID=UPI003890A6A9